LFFDTTLRGSSNYDTIVKILGVFVSFKKVGQLGDEIYPEKSKETMTQEITMRTPSTGLVMALGPQTFILVPTILRKLFE
jgi:hypothetical protein